ncbi:hypothetical protein IT396_00050 [Candidatus Nomurabacteria bacterium]|nr:hypothetical protein [Candidatus Nomurabacteria bacterium]
MITKKLSFYAVLVFTLAFALPVYAAELKLVTNPLKPVAGEEFIIEVKLDSQTDSINAVESVLEIDDLDVDHISTGGSALSLWPVGPHYKPGAGEIEFVGGALEPVAAGETVLLFTIAARASQAGTYVISNNTTRAYKNDGRGTPVSIISKSHKITVAEAGEAKMSTPKDTVSPEFVSVEVGQDPSLFGGRMFLSFFAEDDQSGVATYEVREGFFNMYKKADRYYVLHDESQGQDVWVRATDAAGNSTVYKISSTHQHHAWVWWMGGILVLVIAGFYMYRTRFLRRH